MAQAVGEVRSICEGLRPPGIDDLGLPRALAGLAHRTETPELTIDVRVDDRLGPDRALDPAVEVALYRIAAEALANVARHSGARCATLEVRAEDEVVRLVVRDDGTGLTGTDGVGSRLPVAGRSGGGVPGAGGSGHGRPGPGSGLGLVSIRRRAEEIGGRVTIAVGPEGSGTVVDATLPVTVGGGA